jgi:hypothetical protein
VLGQDRRRLYKADERVKGAMKDDRPCLFLPEEKSTNAYPEEHSEFVQCCWDDMTRPSECAKDEVRDTQVNSDGALLCVS